MRNKLSVILVALIFLLGLGITLYPTISNYLAEKNQMENIQIMQNNVEKLDPEEIEKIKNEAMEYNSALTGDGIKDPFIPGSGVVLPDNYNQIMDFGDGIMAELIIPAIGVELPIYHGTSDEILAKGVGHLKETAFPIGGEGTHCVVSGHTGLPSARLLTDLEDIEIGEYFYIKTMGETLAYKIDDIHSVEPYDTSDLKPVKNKDYVTIITCTPYGINTHRLIVRGERVPYTPSETEEQGPYTVVNIIGLQSVGWGVVGAVIGGVVLVIVILFIIILKTGKKDKKNKSKNKKEKNKKNIEDRLVDKSLEEDFEIEFISVIDDVFKEEKRALTDEYGVEFVDGHESYASSVNDINIEWVE